MESDEAMLKPGSVLVVLDCELPCGWTFAGTVLRALPEATALAKGTRVFVVADSEELPAALCSPCPVPFEFVSLDQVQHRLPCIVPDLGAVMYPCAFPDDVALFRDLTRSHTFYALTESIKPMGTSLRQGVYITPVDSDGRYRLLRCSTNMSGPTEDFAAVDDRIAATVNDLVRVNFEGAAPVNHVLAQVYTNSATTPQKQRKARISAHSDKTKDMPPNAVLAFVSLYSGPVTDTEQCSSLLWRAKTEPKTTVRVVLLPGSVLLVPLSTNRLWTHETRPSMLPVDRLPVRLGYVLRASNTWARFDDALHTTVLLDTVPVALPLPLHPPTSEDIEGLRALYRLENSGTSWVQYPHPVRFSLNQGDYLPPRCRPRTESSPACGAGSSTAPL